MNVKVIMVVHIFVTTKLDHLIVNAEVDIHYKQMEKHV